MTDQPPACNTGVDTPTYTVVLDYLAAHVEASVEDVVQRLAAEIGATPRLGRGMHGYSHCAELCSGDDVWTRVFYTPGGTPWLQASGQNAQPIENALRRLGFPYRVTRKDAALDLYDAEWFPVLTQVGKDHATRNAPPLKVEHAGDWQYGIKGRTLYLGSRSSRAFIRLYEKGRKEHCDPNWVRLEVQYNPQGEHEQRQAAQMTAAQVWTLRAFPIFGKAIGIEAAELFDYPAAPLTRRARDQERARRALCDQYGKHIESWLRDCGGDPEAFVAELLHGIEHQRTVRAWKAAPPANAPELTP